MADISMIEPARPAVGVSKGWVPTEHIDEVYPPPRPTPSDWLVAGDVLRLAPFDDDEEQPGRALREGETISFEELTDFPSVHAVWNGPNDYELLSSVPAGATLFCLPCDPDTLGTSIADFMRDNGDAGHFEPGERLEIQAYDWSEAKFSLRGGQFVPAAGEPVHG